VREEAAAWEGQHQAILGLQADKQMLLGALEELVADIGGLASEYEICREIYRSSYGKAAAAAIKKARAA